MKKAVSAVFVCGEKIFCVKRQTFLKAFPGYTAFVGGKVDRQEDPSLLARPFLNDEDPLLVSALIREIKEELSFDLVSAIEEKKVISMSRLGNALTPDFSPVRFDTCFFKIVLNEELAFTIDKGEFSRGEWLKAREFFEKYKRGEILLVVPTLKLISAFAEKGEAVEKMDLNLRYDPSTEVPSIESIFGVKQFLPLSNTFPPANRTNAFLIGDSKKVLVDPSPISREELKKFLYTLKNESVDEIFLTHHHQDHHEYCTLVASERKVPIGMSRYTFDRITDKWGRNYFKGVKVNFYKEGDILTESLAEKVRVYELPGHDEGQLGLADDNFNWFLVSDLIQSFGTVLIKSPEGDMTKYFSSLQRVIEMNPKAILPSHGPLLGGVFKLQETLDHRKMREKKIISLMEKGKNKWEILKEIYSDIDSSLIPHAFSTIESHLKKIKK